MRRPPPAWLFASVSALTVAVGATAADPDDDIRFFQDSRARVRIALRDNTGFRLSEWDEAKSAFRPLAAGPFDGVAVTYSGEAFATRGGRVLRLTTLADAAPADVTDKFGGATAKGDGEVTVTDDDRVFVRGATRHRAADGRYEAAPACGDARGPVLPLTRDIAGNDWALDAAGSDPRATRRVLVSPAQRVTPPTSGLVVLPPDAKPAWQAGAVNHGLKPGAWRFLAADDVGDVWLADTESLWVLHLRPEPHRAKGAPPATNLWGRIRDGGLAGAPVTALTAHPLGGVLVGFGDGRVLRVVSTDFADWQSAQQPPGKVSVAELRPKGDGPARALWLDRGGRVWAATAGGVAPIATPQGPGGWRRLPSLPWGVMGAGACAFQDRLYVGGSLHGLYGLPASPHTGAIHVLSADRHSPWRRAGLLRLGRGFTGTTEWDGRLWFVGGTSIPWHGCGPTDWVECLDPNTGELDIGPRVFGWRAHAAAVAWRNRLYVMGMAMRNSEHWGFMESLGVGEKAWRKEESPPAEFTRTAQAGIYDRLPVSACLMDDIFYVFVSEKGMLSYYPATRTWRSDLAKSPEAPYQPHVLAVDGEVWLVANEAVHAYSPARDTWRRVAPLPARRDWGFAGRMGDELVVGGGHACGAGNRQIYASREAFALALPAGDAR